MCINNKLADFAKVGRVILGVARNYKPLKNPLAEPIIFSKLPSAYLTPTAISKSNHVVIPQGFVVKADVSLGVIIGSKAHRVEEGEADCVIGGYCLALDLTATTPLEHLMENKLPWTIAKSFNTSCVVSDFIPAKKLYNPHDTELWMRLNGELVQKDSTKNMQTNISEIITYISKYITLHPNDLILTGSPHTITKVPAQLNHEDIVECGLGKDVSMKVKVLEETQLSDQDLILNF